MKTVFTYFAMLIIPATVAAQPPVENNGEFYYVGDVVTMVNCDVTGLNAGAAGAGVSWDFSGLVQSGPLLVTRYTTESSSAFLTSNLVAILPNGMKKHLQQSSTDTYINGLEDTTTGGSIIYYRSYPDSRRPMTFNTSYIDTFAKTVPATGETGIGILSVTADAYGTLKLPTGTFNNVLRVKKYINEIDTIGFSTPPTIATSTTTTYVYLDTMHHAPLLRIDSVVGTLASNVSVMYLSGNTGLTRNPKPADFNANLHGNELLLVGRFDAGATYEVTVYNIIGSLVFAGSFSTTSGSHRFDISKEVLPGIYIITLQQTNEPESKRTIKVFKQ